MFIDLTTQERLDIRQQSFSGTDLNTSTDKMGIVYSFEPNKLTDKQHTVSSIIDHHNNDICLVKHTEARSVECDSDDEVRYIKNNCIAIEFNEPDLIFKKPIIITQTPYKLQDEIKSKILSFLNIYNQFETKMFVYEGNITQKHHRNAFTKDYLDYKSYIEPNAVYNKVLPKEIINAFKRNLTYYRSNDEVLEKIYLDIVENKLTDTLFPRSLAKEYKRIILKDVKANKYTLDEVFEELEGVMNEVFDC